MKITLMYNPQAGESTLPVEDIVASLMKRGGKVLLQGTKNGGVKEALTKNCDFIIIAGGDGTIEKIARKIVHQRVPIAILPFGNANNIAESLDVDATIDAIVTSWKSKDFSKFSIGAVCFEQESRYFLESVGWGLFAEVLYEIRREKKGKKKRPAEKENKVASGLSRLTQALSALQPSYYQVLLDGADHSGYYLWVEIMNTQSMGPRLQMAPEATQGDEFLDVVLVKEEDKEIAEWFLQNQDKEENGHQFKILKAKDIKVKSPEPIHIDDEIYQGKDLSKDWLEIKLLPQFFWVINA